VACETLNPSFSSSPWIRGAPTRSTRPRETGDLRLPRLHLYRRQVASRKVPPQAAIPPGSYEGETQGSWGRTATANAPVNPRARGMAGAGRQRLRRISRSADELGRVKCLPTRDHPAVVGDTLQPQPKGLSHLGSHDEAGERLAPQAANPSPLAKSAFRRQTPEVRAVCVNAHVRICAGGAGQLASLPRPRFVTTRAKFEP
jgi:hypothetical protein